MSSWHLTSVYECVNEIWSVKVPWVVGTLEKCYISTIHLPFAMLYVDYKQHSKQHEHYILWTC